MLQVPVACQAQVVQSVRLDSLEAPAYKVSVYLVDVISRVRYLVIQNAFNYRALS